MSVRWSWSLDGERFQGGCKTPEDAYWEALAESEPDDLEPGMGVRVGEIRELTPSGFMSDLSISHLIEGASEEAYEFLPDQSEAWLDEVSAEDERALKQAVAAVFDRWCKERHPLRFWDIGEIQCLVMTPADLLRVHGPEVAARLRWGSE